MKLHRKKSLAAFNTFGIEVMAEYWAEIGSVGDLEELMQDSTRKGIPRMVLGGGSNLLFTRDYEGLIIRSAIGGIRTVSEDADEVLLEAGGGIVWHDLVLYCLGRNWGGIENLSLIPGQVGAAPIQNIGAYGVEIRDVFAGLEAIDLETGRKMQFSAADCQFGYRDSVFKHEFRDRLMITRVQIRLQKHPVLNTSYGDITKELAVLDREPTIKDVSDAVIRIRRSKLPDPAEVGNAGSFFKNPEVSDDQFGQLRSQYPDIAGYPTGSGRTKIPAAWLIDRAGWKGKRFGNYGVHDRQALVLVNYGGARGLDILHLSEQIQADIFTKYGIELEREVNVI